MDDEVAKRVEKMKEYADAGKIWIKIGNRTYFINNSEYQKVEEFRKGKRK